MDKDYLGISDVDLGTLKSAFLTPARDNVLYTDVLTADEVAEYMSKISDLSKEDKLKIVTKKLNDVYTGKFFDEKELNKQEAIIVLLLKAIPFEKEEADIYWKHRAESGIHEDTKNILIEVAAMHPLINGKPGNEFREHLEQAIDLYHQEIKKGNTPIIYIPGSLHYIVDKENNVPKVDSQPLSEAGKEFLIEHGIPEEFIRANVVNLDIKKEDGVYNSGDECYVATQIAKEENCGRILSVVSPVQLYRKALFYQEFGYNPELYATGTERTNHNYIGELFWSLYITYMNDQDWQTGFLSYLTRKERDIEYPEKIKAYSKFVEKIIKNGPGIPQEIFELKKQWLEKYEHAKTNMDTARLTKEDILINLIRTEGMQDLEQKRILDIINQNPDSETTIVYSALSNIDDILELLEKYKSSKPVKLKSLDGINVQNIANEFKNGNYKKIFGMYPSSICMKNAIEFIQEGVIPIVSTLPDKDCNYIDNIASMFENIIKQNNPDKRIKDKHDDKDDLDL